MAILAQAKVLTLDYWKFAKDIEVGDYLFDKEGNLTRVKLVQSFFANECYEIGFTDGLTIAGDHNLTMFVEDKRHRKRIVEYKGVQSFRRPLKQFTARQLSEMPIYGTKVHPWIYSVQTTKPLKFPHQPLPVPPFVFGYWIASHNGAKGMRKHPEHWDYIREKFRDYGYQVKETKYHFKLTPTVESQFVPNIPHKIPNNYLLAAPDQRIELLSGIFYAKPRAYNVKMDAFRLFSVRPQFLNQVRQVAESLGLRTLLTTMGKTNKYQLYFKSKLQLVHYQKPTNLKVHIARRYINQINKIQPQMCVHIETDESFAVGEGFISCR